MGAKLDRGQVARLRKAFAMGYSIPECMEYADVTHSTVDRYIGKFPWVCPCGMSRAEHRGGRTQMCWAREARKLAKKDA